MAKNRQGEAFGDWIVMSADSHKGGNSRVWIVERKDDPGQERAAIKILNADRFQTKRYQRFKDEVNFVTNNPDDGILPIIDHHLPKRPLEANVPWYVMPLAESIQTLLQKKPRMEAVVEALLPVAKTLARIHGKSVAHRDIKPDNILAFQGQAVLSDFGLVDYPTKLDVTSPDERIGPALFIAPEMFAEAADIDARPGDVYSFAKTLWVLAAKKRWPPPGKLDIGDPRLRLSALVDHPEIKLIDLLLDWMTRTSPEDRPTMPDVHRELTNWRKLTKMGSKERKTTCEAMAARFEAMNAAAAPRIAEHQKLKESAHWGLERLKPYLTSFMKHVADTTGGKLGENGTSSQASRQSGATGDHRHA